MSPETVTHHDQIDSTWLTEALHNAGALHDGHVVAIDQTPLSSNWSQSAWLQPEYEPGTRGERPASLLLKICADPEESFGPSEVHYYTRDYVDVEDAPIVRCYHAAYQSSPRAYHLLMEDVRGTHGDGFSVAPTLALACATAQALARLHARYWGRERLAAHEVGPPIEAHLERYSAHIEPGLRPMLDDLGDDLPLARRELLHRIFGEHSRLMADRLHDDAGFTLVHGDLNPGNVLWPRQGDGPVYLIDRQPFDWSLQSWLGASDLARLMIIPWQPEDRRRWQIPVLQHYQDALKRLGIDYPWSQLLLDYRLAAIESIDIAVEWCRDESSLSANRHLWPWMLERALRAFDDLDCAELLD